MTIIWNKGSFRDPKNKVFEYDQNIFRYINEIGISDYKKIKNSGILNESIENNFLIDTKELDKNHFLFSSGYFSKSDTILRHEKIPFISYPYEWSFEQLKSAALLHLNFQIFLLEKNFILKDASAFNIQFIGKKPIFIDCMSLEEYKDGSYWIGYKQFCEHFLNPLLLTSKKKIPFNYLLRSNLEGLSSKDLSNLFSFFDKFSINIFSHVVLQAKFEKKSLLDEKNTISKYKNLKKFPKKNYISLLLLLKNWISKLDSEKRKTTWSDYAEINTYKNNEKNEKFSIVENFSKKFKPNLLFDFGCNTGDYSLASLNGGAKYVVGLDFDFEALNQASKRSDNFLPLWMDSANPSPSQGFDGFERLGLKERAKPDALIALAFIHHMVIAKNISMEMFVKWLTSIAGKGLIEFVPKNDETVKKMLISKEDIFFDYNLENLVSNLNREHMINSIINVSESGRKIIEYQKK